MPQTINFTPLETPGADEAANPIQIVRRSKKQMSIVMLGAAVIGLPMLAIIAYVVPSTVPQQVAYAGVASEALSQYGLIVSLSASGLFIVWLVALIIRFRLNGEPVLPVFRRIPAFAAANGLALDFNSTDHSVTGWLFDTRPRLTTYRLHSSSGRGFEIGELATVRPETKLDPGMEPAAYVAVRLDRKLPHMAFLSTQARVPNWLSVDRSQQLPLEGNFQSYFDFFAPKGYEVDALQIVTPDVMAALVDDAAAWHIEIVDDWVIFTKGYSFEKNTVEDWQQIFRIIAAVAPEVVAQGDTYRDERTAPTAPNVIAPAGRRLRTTTPSIVVVGMSALGIGIILFFALLAPLLNYPPQIADNLVRAELTTGNVSYEVENYFPREHTSSVNIEPSELPLIPCDAAGTVRWPTRSIIYVTGEFDHAAALEPIAREWQSRPGWTVVRKTGSAGQLALTLDNVNGMHLEVGYFNGGAELWIDALSPCFAHGPNYPSDSGS